VSLCSATVLPPLLTPGEAQQKEVRQGFLDWKGSQLEG
jgi:hypothetical protein